MAQQTTEKKYMQNRELSWLRFNERVLEEASDPSVPLMERLKFVSIFTSNLDEFFMVRVGSLFDLSLLKGDEKDSKSNLTPQEQLHSIYSAVHPLYKKREGIYREIEKNLRKYDIYSLDMAELESSEQKYIKNYYKTSIRPILSPQIVDAHHPFPYIPSKEIFIAAILKSNARTLLGILPLPVNLPEVIFLPGNDVRFIATEKVLFEFVEDVYSMYQIVEKNCLSITRNADISSDDEAFELEDDFRSLMKKLLHKRKRLSVVRLEANHPLSAKFSNFLCDRFQLVKRQIFVSKTPMKMPYVFSIFDKLSFAQKKQLTYPEFSPQPSCSLDLDDSLIKQIKRSDVLLSYPFESMEAFLQLIKEAAYDSNVISIKITIYRLARKAKLIEYLCAAAEGGKDVTVLIELRARFDEQNNIDWSERLEEAGCRLIYGFDVYKVHSKICLITLKEKTGVSFITQLGTGNYNEKTAELYTDLSLITSDFQIGEDAMEFFKNMAIGNLNGKYQELLVAPHYFKSNLMDLIDSEIIKGKDGKITFKMNSLTDVDLIQKLSEASKAGVTVKLIIRGICCLLPQVETLTENIRVISIVGRFLEHSRIYSFGEGDDQKIYLSSGDLMTRNTQRRVEIACPVHDQNLKTRINQMFEAMWYDNVKSRVLGPDGIYYKKADNRAAINCQEFFIEEAIQNTESCKGKKASNPVLKWINRLKNKKAV